MAKGFNLTAQINLQGPSNVNVIVSNIKKQLGTISANVNLKIDPASAKTVASLNSSLNQLNLTLKTTSISAKNAADAVRDLLSAMKGVSSVKMPAQISSSLTSVASSSASAQKALAASRTEIEEFGNQAGLAVRRFAAFSTVTSVIYGLTGAISNGISEFIDFDQQLTRISQVTGESKDELGRLKGTITSLSTGLGVTAKDLASVSVTLSQAGLSARETENALEALALSALTPSFDNMNETVEGSIALMRQFKIGSNELEAALGSINAVSAKFAVESSDIISAIQRTGGVFAAASKGVSEGKDALNEFIAVFTSVRATTRESAETIATGLRTIFTRLQRGDTIEALKEYGVNLTDLDGKFVGAYKAVQLLSEGLGQIDPRDLKFSQIVEELGGFRQIGKVIPLIQEFTTAQQALQIAQSGQGSLASDAAKGQLALAVQISKTKQEFLSLIRSIGDTDSFQKMVTVGLSLANALIKVADAAKGIIPLIGLFAAFKAASAIRQFGSGFGSGFGGGAAKQNNRPLGFATGGLVPGQGNSDSVSARLTPGEFVMSKSAVRSIGVGNLHRANGGAISKRYASGGVAGLSKLSPGQSGNRISDYIDYYDNETKETNKKQTGNRKKRSNTESPNMLKGFQLKDNVNSGIKRRVINESKIKKALGDNEEFKNYINSIASKDKKREFYAAQGVAFEEFLFEKILNQENYIKAPTKNYPLDFIPTKSGLPPVEAKFTYEQVPDAFILNKRLRYNLLRNQDETIAPLSRRARPDNIQLGPTVVYEMQAGLKNKIFSPGATKETIEGRKERADKKLLKIDKLGLKRSTGGYIQKFAKAGKVADQTVYHGTGRDLDELDVTKSPGGVIGAGIYTGLNTTGLAAQYAKKGMDRSGGSGGIYPLKIKGGISDFPEATAPVSKNPKVLKGIQNIFKTEKIPSNGIDLKTASFSTTLDFIIGHLAERIEPKLRKQKDVKDTGFEAIKIASQKARELMVANGIAGAKKIADRELDGQMAAIYDPKRIMEVGKPILPKNKATGGSIRKFVNGTTVTPTAGTAATSTDIFRVLTLDEVIKDTGSNAGDIQRILKKRKSLSPSEQAIKEKILAAYTKKAAGIQTANNLDIEKATTEGLLFGAAGFKGKAFATTNRMDIPGLNNPVKVRITSGVLDKEAAGKDIKRMTKAMSGENQNIAKNMQIRQILKEVGPIYSDFDRTLAFGADKILADPKKPRFSEFADTTKVQAALNKATLSKLGKALRNQVKETPQLLDNLHVISARPPETMGLIRKWLADQKLPIYKLKGVGGPDNTEEKIAELKVQYMQEQGSSGAFIDDNKENVEKAKAAGITTYHYANKKVKASDRKKMGEANAQGYMAENIIHQLGGPIGNKAAINYGIDFPDGLQEAAKYFKLPPNIPTDAKLTLNGPAELKGQIGNYLKARGYAGGGSVTADYYSLEKNSGLKSFEFDNAVKFAKTMNYSMSEFQTYLKKLQTDKQNKSGLKTDKDTLRKSLIPGTATATSRQMSLAESLKGPSDAGYRPILTEPQRIVADRANIRKSAIDDLRGTLSQGYAEGGTAQNKPEKQYGEISVSEDAGMVSVGYLKNNTRAGYASAYKMRDNLYYVGLSSATKGYGPRLYDILMEAVSEKGSMLTSDRSSVSPDAKAVWAYYFKNRGDVKKTPLKPSDWTLNSSLLDPKLHGRQETWPAPTDPAWILQSGYSKSPNLINGPDVKREKFASGGHVQAMVSNGEAYVPPEQARQIGYDKLKQMNQADRNGMSSFSSGGGISVFSGPGNGTSDSIGPISLPVGSFILREKATKALGLRSGGPVGSVQEFAIGGAVQRLFFGGPTLPARPDNPTEGNVQISSNVGDQLKGMVKALNDLGITSSKTADIINKGGQISYEAAVKAYSADIQRMKLSGAAASQVADAEKRLRDIREEAAKSVDTRKKLSGVGGDKLQSIDIAAQYEKERLSKKAENQFRKQGLKGEDLDKALANIAPNIQQKAYQTAAKSQNVDLKGMGLNGQDMQKYIQQSMMDAKTLQKMNAQYLQTRIKDLTAVGKSAEEARKIAQKEIKEREAILSDVAKSRGMKDPTGKGSSDKFNQRMMMAAFMLPMIGSASASLINPESSASAAATNAGIQGATNTVGMGMGVMQMLPSLGPLGIALATTAIAVAATGQAMIDARNAVIEFNKKLGQTRAEKALEQVAKLFEKLEKDIKNIDLKQALTSKLVEASTNMKINVEADMKQAKAYWLNLLDAYFGGGGTVEGDRKSAERSQILDKKGIMAYLESTGFGQAMMGNFSMPGGAADQKAEISRSAQMRSLAPERAQQEAKAFADTANQINRLMEMRFQSGESVDNVMGKDSSGVPSVEFKQFAEALSRANSAIGEQILNIQSDISLGEAEKKAKIERIKISYAESEAIRINTIVSRQKELKAIEQSTNLFSRSLERMYQNMEQAIASTVFSLEKMSQEIDLMASSFKGEATVGKTSLNSINVLQNPRAYSEKEKDSARNQASSIFSGNRNLVKGLLGAGDNLETSIMKTLNDTIKKNPSANNEQIGMAIEKSVREQLNSLALPSDVGDKLAKEVQKALNDLRKEGNEKVDFSQLVEKIPQLSKVIESTKRAQEVALKALENWQNALNSYSARTNQLIELQIDTNSRLRKSTQILADSQLDLAKALGQSIEIADTRRASELKTSQLTGGLTKPQDISQNILSLEGNRRALQTGSDMAGNRGAGGVNDFMSMQKGLKDTSVALRENYEALKNLADNSDTASAALGKIQEAQQKNQGRVSFIEKLVTSTPAEMDSLNMALGRLQKNMNGQANSLQQSQGAQKAYYEALQNGASGFEAMREAQAAFASERRETLGALNDILPFLGNNKQSNNIKANVLETMLQESGQGVTPIMQQVLTTLRNPQADPETQAAMAQYQQAINLQSEANKQLAMLNSRLASDIASQSAEALKEALMGASIKFENAELNDIQGHVRSIDNKIGDRSAPPVGRASGGMIYAAAGMNVDFAPKGTDTVPAMLTPGEFVVNRSATQKNLPLLQSINSQKYSSGGSVKYYAAGGYVSNIMRPELRSDRTGDSFQETSETYLDPKQETFKKLLEDKTDSVYNGWKHYTRSQRAPNDAPSYSPARWSSFATGNGSIPFASDGTIMPGAAPRIESDGQYFRYSSSQPTAVDPINEPKKLGYLLANTELGKRRLVKSEIDQYKRDIRSIKTGTGASLWGKKADDFNIGNITELDSLLGQEGSVGTTYDPNLKTSKNIGILLGKHSERPDIDAILADQDLQDIKKVFLEMTSFGYNGTIVGLSANAATKGTIRTDSSKIELDPARNNSRAGTDARDTGRVIDSLSTPRTNAVPSSSMVAPHWKNKAEDIKALVEVQKRNIAEYEKAVTAVDTDSFVFGKSGNNNNLIALQKQLENLYENRSVVEDITPSLDLLDLDSLGTDEPITRLNILSDMTNQKIMDRMKELEAIPDVRATQGWPDLNVGFKGPTLRQNWMNGIPIDIEDEFSNVKTFPWIGNLDPTQLLAELKADIENKKADLSSGASYGITKTMIAPSPITEKLPAPLDKYSLKHSEQYYKYSGRFWNPEDPTADANGFIPKVMKDYFVVDPSTADEDMFKSAGSLKERNFFNKNNPFTLGDLIGRMSQNQKQNISDYIKNPTDPKLMAGIKGISVGINPSLIRSKTTDRPTGLEEPFPLFSKEDNTSVNVNMGNYLTHALEELARDQQNKGNQVVNEVDDAPGLGNVIADKDKKQAAVKLTRGALMAFGRTKIPGVDNGWLYNNIGRAPAILSLAKNNDVVKNITSQIAGVFNTFAGITANAGKMSKSPGEYNGLKEAYYGMIGAYKAFSGLSNGDTRFLKLLQDQGDYLALFRSLGSQAQFQEAANNDLTQDTQLQLGKSLNKSKLRKVGADGSLSYEDFENNIPKTYQDLVDAALNPYNEFNTTDIRKNLIDTLSTDISNGKDKYGMSFFDPRTLGFIKNNLSTLQTWYAGDGKVWPGQDSFYDERLDPKTRTDNVINALNNNAAGGLLDQANLANTQLGVATKFGNLPTARWFEARKVANLAYKATGGMIYASEGQMINFQPRGTDTVPAMLTPGEFVVNRQATQKNLPLLRSINSSNTSAKGYSSGGVAYLASGGQPEKTKPEFDLGTTTVNKSENSFGNRSVNTLSQVQYESRYGIPGIRNNIKMIPDELYEQLSRQSAESSKLKKEAQGFFSVDKEKLKAGKKLNLNKTDYTKLSIGETERLVPNFKRNTQEYYPNGADFDHKAFDKTMLEYKDLPTINYLNADIRTADQRKEAISQAASARENGFPDLMAKYLLGLQDYESTWASSGLALLIDAPNLAMPDASDFGANVLPKVLKSLSKSGVGTAIKSTIAKGKGGLSSLYKSAFKKVDVGSIQIPTKELGTTRIDVGAGIDTVPAPAAATGKKTASPPSTAGKVGSKLDDVIEIDPNMISKQLSSFNAGSGPATLKDFSGNYYGKVNKDNIYQQITSFIKLMGLENDPSLVIPKTVTWPESASGAGGYFREALSGAYNAVAGRPRTGTRAGAGEVALVKQHAYTGVLNHELTHQLISTIRKTKPGGADAWTKYQTKILELFDSGNPSNFINGFDALGSGYNSADVLYATRYKLHALSEMTKTGEALPPNVKALYDRLISSRYSLKNVTDSDNSVMTDYIASKYGTNYIRTISGHGHEEFLTTLVENVNRLGRNELGLLDGTLNEMLSSIGMRRSSSLVDLSGLSGNVGIPRVKGRGNLRGLTSRVGEAAKGGYDKVSQANKILTEKLKKLMDWKKAKSKAGKASDEGSLIKETMDEADKIGKETSKEVGADETLSGKIKRAVREMLDLSGNVMINKLPVNLMALGARVGPEIQRNMEAKTEVTPPKGEPFLSTETKEPLKLPEQKEQRQQEKANIDTALSDPNLPFTAKEALKNARDKYYDELTYKEYLASLIKSGKSPEAPDKKLFTTPAFYTTDENGQKTRVTAYDTRETSRKVGGGPDINNEDINRPEVEKLANQIFFDYNTAQIGLEAFRNPKNDDNTKTLALSGIEGDYGNLVNKVTKLSTLTNLSRMNNKPIMVGESKNIPFSIDDVINRLRVMREIYNNEILAKKKETLGKVNDSILDEFAANTATMVEQNDVQAPANGKPFTGKQVRQDRGIAAPIQIPFKDRPIRGMAGVETQYKNSYNHYRRILGEYNYHQGIGKGERYAQGNKTTSRVAKTLSSGGMVYASTGMMIPYAPKGTDTVPAMLTPGEFVINRAATQKNLPLLKSINSGSSNYSSGGVVYAKDGAFIPYRAGSQKLEQQSRRDIERQRKEAIEAERQQLKDNVESERKALGERIAQARNNRRDAYVTRGLPRQQTSQQPNQQPNQQQNRQSNQQQQNQQSNPQMSISPQMSQRVGMAAQAAFDPQHSGDVNKQLAIFGTLLNGTNQVLTQFGMTLENMVKGMGATPVGGGVNNTSRGQEGGQTQSGQLDGLSQFTTKFGEFIGQLQKINLPPVINIMGNHKVEVIFNGAEILRELQPQISELVVSQVGNAMKTISDQTEGGIKYQV